MCDIFAHLSRRDLRDEELNQGNKQRGHVSDMWAKEIRVTNPSVSHALSSWAKAKGAPS